MTYRTDDPLRDWDRYYDEQEGKAERLPKCAACGEPIFQDRAVRIGDDWYCDECLDEMREEIEYDDF